MVWQIWNWARLIAEIMLNEILLILWRYLNDLLWRTYFSVSVKYGAVKKTRIMYRSTLRSPCLVMVLVRSYPRIVSPNQSHCQITFFICKLMISQNLILAVCMWPADVGCMRCYPRIVPHGMCRPYVTTRCKLNFGLLNLMIIILKSYYHLNQTLITYTGSMPMKFYGIVAPI